MIQVKNLIDKFSQLAKVIDAKAAQIRYDMLMKQQAYVKCCHCEKKGKKRLGELQSTLSQLKKHEIDLCTDMQRTSAEMKKIKFAIVEEETTRIDGIIDLLPLVGVIGGIVTGRIKRAIPLYSQFAAIISVGTDEKENHEQRLRQKQKVQNQLTLEQTSIINEMQRKIVLVNLYEAQIARSEREQLWLERKIRKLGATLVDFSNLSLSLRLKIIDYDFFLQEIHIYNGVLSNGGLSASTFSKSVKRKCGSRIFNSDFI